MTKLGDNNASQQHCKFVESHTLLTYLCQK